MKKIAIALLTSIIIAGISPAIAQDAAQGKAKSSSCVACHGANGISMIPMYPNLAGQKQQYLELQLKAFRDGTRKNPIMSPLSAGLSDEDIADISAYYANLNPAG